MKSKKPPMNFRFRYFILASVFVHAVVLSILYLSPLLKDSLSIFPHKPELVEISFLETPTKNEKIINPTSVVESDSAAANNELSENAKFLSEKSNSVKKETKAKSGTQFHNARQGKKTSNEPQLLKQQKVNPSVANIKSEKFDTSDKSEIFEKSFDAYASISKKNVPIQQQNENISGSTDSSTTNDNLENIQDDLMTRLNTKEYKYFGYYSRIKKQLNQWWVPKVQQKFTKILSQGRTVASEENKITKLVIILNDVGNLVKVQVLAESGIRELDDAAIEAFRSAAPFPNPPKGMVESDGTVKIRWDCIVEG